VSIVLSIDVKMAWRNIWRHPRRSLLTTAAIAFATIVLIFMLSWQFGSYSTMINATVKTQTGHIQVQAEGYQDKRGIRLVVPHPGGVGDMLDRTAGVADYSFRANAFSLISSEKRTYGGMVVGIDPVREAGVSTIPQLVRQGKYLSPGDKNQALVGRLLARNLQVGPGDELVVLGQGRDGSIAATVVKVKGIFSSGQDERDRRLMHVPLEYFQDLYAMRGAVHEVVVLCESLEQVPKVKNRIAASLETVEEGESLVVLDWKELVPGLIEAIKVDLASGFIFYIILIVVVAFSILNTFLMAIFERTKEFGVLMAIGTKPGRLFRILLLESTCMTVLGVVVGMVVGSLITWHFQVHGIVISSASEILRQFGLPDRIYPQLSVWSVSIGAGIVLLITSITALYPALRVHRMSPVEAMAAV
jgi:ABC-type lipoprotein release transport system permease subunit